MRFCIQKINDHSAVFMSSDVNERRNTCRMVLSCWPLEERRKDLVTRCRPWGCTQSVMEKRTCKKEEKPIQQLCDQREKSNFCQKSVRDLLFFLVRSLPAFGRGSLTSEWCLLSSTWPINTRAFFQKDCIVITHYLLHCLEGWKNLS